MSQPLSLSQREDIINLYKQGLPMLQISVQQGVNYGTIKSLIKRFKEIGVEAIKPRFSNCGRKRSYDSERSYRLVRWYKRYHPQWGVGYILMKIQEKHPHLGVNVCRVYERRLKAENILTLSKNPPLQTLYHPPESRLPHDTWQVDAKERLVTLDTQSACYLTITDEKSGCVLEAKVFPLRPY